MDKDQRADIYQEKKLKQDKIKHKKKQLSTGKTEQFENLLEKIEVLPAKKLLDFMEEKFTKIVDQNEKVFSDLYKAITRRLKSYQVEFKNEQHQKLNSFICKHTGRPLTEGQIKTINLKYGVTAFNTTPKTMVQVQNHAEFGSVLRVSFDHVPNVSTLIYNGDEINTIFYEVSAKRLKNEATEILTNFVQLERKVESL